MERNNAERLIEAALDREAIRTHAERTEDGSSCVFYADRRATPYRELHGEACRIMMLKLDCDFVRRMGRPAYVSVY